MSKVTKELSTVEVGATFEVAGMEFIKFPEVMGMTPVVAKDTVFDSEFGKDNDFRSSKVYERLTKEILPRIAEEIGEGNICEFKTDLTTLDGLKPYGEMTSKISLPTLDFYRENVEIFDKYKLDEWWWLATPESARPHDNPYWFLCVSPSGYVDYDGAINVSGVRPFLYFVSSIFCGVARNDSEASNTHAKYADDVEPKATTEPLQTTAVSCEE